MSDLALGGDVVLLQRREMAQALRLLDEPAALHADGAQVDDRQRQLLPYRPLLRVQRLEIVVPLNRQRPPLLQRYLVNAQPPHNTREKTEFFPRTSCSKPCKTLQDRVVTIKFQFKSIFFLEKRDQIGITLLEAHYNLVECRTNPFEREITTVKLGKRR